MHFRQTNAHNFLLFAIQLMFLFLFFLIVLADNLKSNPGIKWQYFSSEEGIFTVFPAHKFRCKGSYEHRSRYDLTKDFKNSEYEKIIDNCFHCSASFHTPY